MQSSWCFTRPGVVFILIQLSCNKCNFQAAHSSNPSRTSARTYTSHPLHNETLNKSRAEEPNWNCSTLLSIIWKHPAMWINFHLGRIRGPYTRRVHNWKRAVFARVVIASQPKFNPQFGSAGTLVDSIIGFLPPVGELVIGWLNGGETCKASKRRLFV